MRKYLGFLLLLVGCIDHPEAPAAPPVDAPFTDANDTPPPSKNTPAPAPTPVTTKDPLKVLTEVVHIVMKSYDDENATFFCTGALVANDTVVTAGHCFQESFYDFEIIATLAPGAPRVKASWHNAMNTDSSDISGSDIGFLKLEEPIELPQYAKLTNVADEVEGGKKLDVALLARNEENAMSTFKGMNLSVFSTTEAGYDHGFGTKYFSRGGDSGTGLFLVENGAITHKLVGVLREPEESEGRDHFTRIDDAFLDWFGENQ